LAECGGANAERERRSLVTSQRKIMSLDRRLIDDIGTC
jgi:hypothetical protein